MPRLAFTLLLVLFVSSPVRGAEPIVLNLWPDTPPGPRSFAEGDERDLQKPDDRLVGGKTVMKLGHVSVPQIHVYLAPQETANGAACVICPGGGFSILAWDLEGVEVAEWLNSFGVTAIVCKYRVPTRQHESDDRWRGPVMDTQRALSMTRARAEEWNIDPRRVGVLGFSAGGNTAAHALVEDEQRLYAPLDGLDKASCGVDFAILVYPAWMASDNGEYDASFRVNANTAPTFFVHAADDRVSCLSSVLMFAELKKAGVKSELHVFGTGGHGYGLRPTEEAVTHWPSRAAAWLDETGLLGK